MDDTSRNFLKVLQGVNKLASLEPFTVTIKCWSFDTGTFETIQFDNAFPFTTIDDVKLHIYDHKKDPAWIPKQVFMGTAYKQVKESDNDYYIGTDNVFLNNSGSDSDFIIMRSPLLAAKQKSPLDRQFVDTSGNLKTVIREDRGRETLEKNYILSDQTGGQVPVFYAFCATDMFAIFGLPEGNAIPERDWNGRFHMYFPALRPDDYEVSNDDINDANLLVQYANASQQMLNSIQNILENDEPSVKMKIENILGLKLKFDYNPLSKMNELEIPFRTVEELFFDIDVNSRRPFVRLLPVLDEPVTMIHVKGLIPIPDIADPILLLQWKDEVSPDPERDYLFMKILTRSPESGALPLYSTVQIFDDGSAYSTLVPSKQHKNGIDPIGDLHDYDRVLFEAVEGTHLQGRDILLEEVSLTLGLRLESEDKHLTKKILQKRLSYFNYFLQEIPNYYNDLKPIILLRYKAVNDFFADSNIYTCIRQNLERYPAQDGHVRQELVNVVSTEFQITHEESKKKILEFLLDSQLYNPTVPELSSFIKKNNPGVDIAIFGTHPVYTIRISRCESIYDLMRIYTILSLYLTSDIETEMSEEIGKAIKVMEPTVQEIKKTQDEEEEAGDVEDFDDSELVNKIVKTIPNKPFDFFFDDEDEIESVTPQPIKKPAAPAANFFFNNDFDGGGNSLISQSGGVKRVFKADEDSELVASLYYIKQLKRLDNRLFEFQPKIKGEKVYARKCQPTDRQPIVLTDAEYKRMLKEYENDTGITFIEYPLRIGEKEPAPIGEVVTIMRYGTNPLSANYYLCPELFCIKDRIMIRPSDFVGTKWRRNYEPADGSPKLKDRCPFCGGQEIVDPSSGKIGYTVLRRASANKADPSKVTNYIGFISPTTHPDNFELPCCFGKIQNFYITDKPFAPFLALAKKGQLKGYNAEQLQLIEAEQADIAAAPTEEDIINYEIVLARLSQEYISDANKHPLKPGKIGLLGSGLDKYFNQNSIGLVKRAIKQELRTGKDSKGFLRMGIHGGRSKDENGFFGVLAPYLKLNTIDDVRNTFLENITPHIFISANYGNLLHEFYNACDPRPSTNELEQWAYTNLNITPNEKNIFELRRAYMSYHAFREYISSKNTFKEYRIFAPILAYKGIITHNGLILIVIEYDSLDLEKSPTVICPPFGYNPNIHTGCDFAFVLRDKSNIYEALFYYEYKTHFNYYLKFNIDADIKDEQVAIAPPPIVINKINEFKNNCKYIGKAIYTSSSSVKADDLITLSELISSPLKQYVNGVVRDIYNHIVGVTLYTGSGRLIPLPVADDGYLPIDLYIYFDWSSIQGLISNADTVMQFYNNQLAPLIEKYNGYKIDGFIRIEGQKTLRAMRLANGALVPARGIIASLPEQIQSLVQTGLYPEYEYNRGIFFTDSPEEECARATQGQESLPEDLATISRAQLEELYQHFRLSVANWLSSSDVTESYRSDVEKVIFARDLPIYEKRKRLMILLNSILSKWFVESEDYIPSRPFIKRKDCRQITNPGKCSDACMWVESNDDNTKSCKIHIPNKTPTFMNTKDVFIMKLIDELIMFKARRQEILNASVKTTVNLKSAIRIEDKWILPESSPSWLELLRLEWAKEVHEVPKYYEEIIAPSTTIEENIPNVKGKPQNITRGEYMYALNEDLLTKLRISDEVTEWSLYVPPEGIAATKLFANTGIREISVESVKKFVALKEIPVYFVKSNSESETLTTKDIKLLLPEVYQTRKLVPRALVIIEVQTVLDDGSINSVTGILVSHKDYQLLTLINDLPVKLQDYFNNRRKMLAVGALEYVATAVAAASEEPQAKTLRFAKRNLQSKVKSK